MLASACAGSKNVVEQLGFSRHAFQSSMYQESSNQTVQSLTCLSKAFTSKALVNEAIHGWDRPFAAALSLFFGRTHRFCIIQLLRAIIDVWSICFHDRCLGVKKHLCRLQLGLPHTGTDLHAIVIGGNPFKVSTMCVDLVSQRGLP